MSYRGQGNREIPHRIRLKSTPPVWMGGGLIGGRQSLRGDIGRSDLRTGTAEAWDRVTATPLAFWLVGTENLVCRTPAESLSFQATVM